MELIDRIKQDMDDRLEELRPQVEQIPRLEAALAALDASGGGGVANRGSARAGTVRRGRPRSAAKSAPMPSVRG